MTTGQTVTEQIEAAIAEAGGSVRVALNDALAGRDAAMGLLKAENEKAIALIVALEAIRGVVWMLDAPSQSMEDINKIACGALRIAGETATTGMIKEEG